MTDEASKLLRELVEAQTAAEEDVRQWNEKLKRDQHATLFAPSESGMRLSAAWYDAIAYVNKTVAALPAAAPRMIQTPAGLAQPWQVGEETDEEHAAAVAAVAAAQPAPLPGPPREPPKGRFDEPCPHFPDRPCYPPLCADGCKDARFIAYSKPTTTDQGAGVIAPKPPDTDAAAKGLSRAGDDADARDAARYRWWREHVYDETRRNSFFVLSDTTNPAELDAAIDAAILADARTEGTRQHAPESTDAALGRLDTTK